MRRKISLLTITLVVLILTACTSSTGEPYGKVRVLLYAGNICENEDFESLYCVRVDDEPTNDEYCFQTDRGLVFTVNSYLSYFSIDGGTAAFCTKELKSDYVDSVHAIYDSKIDELFECYIDINNYEDIDRVVQLIYSANAIYAQELEYNTEEFLEENPNRTATICVITDDGEESIIAYIPIDGLGDEESIRGEIEKAYTQVIYDGEKIDDTVPDSMLTQIHTTPLEHIYLNGNEMLYDTKENSYSDYALSTDKYTGAWYDYTIDSYIVYCDIGKIYSGSSPLIINEYIQELGEEYTIETKNNLFTRKIYVSEWSIGEDIWEMQSKTNDGVKDFKVYKNGELLDITYYTYDEMNKIGSTLVVALSVEDFAQLLNLDYVIDEETASLYYTSK